MKKLILGLIISLLVVSNAYANWKFNVHTGKLDYYESGVNSTDTANWNTAYNNFQNKSTAINTSSTWTGGALLGTGLAPTLANYYITATNISNYTLSALNHANYSLTALQLANYTITGIHLANYTVDAVNLVNTSVVAGSYSTVNLTVDAQGRITNATNGTGAGGGGGANTALSNLVYTQINGDLIFNNTSNITYRVHGGYAPPGTNGNTLFFVGGFRQDGSGGGEIDLYGGNESGADVDILTGMGRAEILLIDDGTIAMTGNVSISSGGSDQHAVCWNGTKLGWCSSVVDINGNCTCQ